MAFSNNPRLDTYSTVRLPLVQSETVEPNSSVGSATLNNMMVNVLPKKMTKLDGNDEWVTRPRPGATVAQLPAGVTASQIRGLYVWEKTTSVTYYFTVIGTGIYTATTLNGTWTLVNSFTNNNVTPVRFTEFISSTNVKSLVAVDGIEGFVFTSNAAGTKIVDADFPSPHIAFPVFLNGRLYLAKAGTGDIYCSDLDDPAAWTPGNFISSEVYPDDVQALVKINNYILAIGLVGCEYFYDAANATGSPLARVENQSLPFGTDFPNSIATTLGGCVFLSKSSDNNTIVRLVEGFTHTDIPCNFLNQFIRIVLNSPTGLGYKILGQLWRDGGSIYYTILLDYTKNSDTDGDYGLTYTYCFDAKMWVQFTRGRDSTRSTFGYALGHKSYPVLFVQPNSGGAPSVIAGNAFNTPFVGTLEDVLRGCDTLCVNSTTALQYFFLNTVTLSNLSFGTNNRKFMYRLGLDYTNETDPAGVDPTLTPRVTWWDTYWGASSATPIPLASSYNQGSGSNATDFPFILQLGSFRHRWIRVEGYGMVIFKYVEVDINKGSR